VDYRSAFQGASVLVRQSLVVAVVVAIGILWAVCLIRLNRRISTTVTWRRVTVFSAVAVGVSLLQVVWTFVNSGVFWFFELVGLIELPANKYPFIELIAYNLPQSSAFLTEVDHPLNPITFFLAKLFFGLSRYDPAVYLGYPPFEGTIVMFSTLQAVLTGVIVVALVALALIPLVKKQLGLTVLYGSVLVVTLQQTFQNHIENRYFLGLRFVVAIAVLSGILWLIPRLALVVEKLRGRSNDSIGVVAQDREKNGSRARESKVESVSDNSP